MGKEIRKGLASGGEEIEYRVLVLPNYKGSIAYVPLLVKGLVSHVLEPPPSKEVNEVTIIQ